jgi:hypothetical protein
MDYLVKEWAAVGGFVKVDGAFVPGGFNVKRVAVRTHTTVNCQHCRARNIEVKLALFARHEPALERAMFWFGIAPGAMRYFCTHCAERFETEVRA